MEDSEIRNINFEKSMFIIQKGKLSKSSIKKAPTVR